MRSFLERIVVRYPCVARRCCEVAAIWVAEEAATLSEGQSLWRSEDDILPGLAQAVRESGVDLAEMARECGIDLIELRRKLALSRLGELLKPGEVWNLSDQALGSKLEQAAREYSLEVEQLLDELSHPCAVIPGTGTALRVKSRAVGSRGSCAAGCAADCGRSAIGSISRRISSARFASCASLHTLATVAYRHIWPISKYSRSRD